MRQSGTHVRDAERLLPALVVAVCVAAAPPPAAAQTDALTVEGVVAFSHSGDIHIKLMNREQFQRDLAGKDPETQFTLVLKVDADRTAGTVPFRFVGVPRGTHVISFYQDVNGNGKLDMGLFGPKEPWGMYKVRPTFKPVFEKSCFELDGDLTGLKLEAK